MGEVKVALEAIDKVNDVATANAVARVKAVAIESARAAEVAVAEAAKAVEAAKVIEAAKAAPTDSLGLLIQANPDITMDVWVAAASFINGRLHAISLGKADQYNYAF